MIQLKLDEAPQEGPEGTQLTPLGMLNIITALNLQASFHSCGGVVQYTVKAVWQFPNRYHIIYVILTSTTARKIRISYKHVQKVVQLTSM